MKQCYIRTRFLSPIVVVQDISRQDQDISRLGEERVNKLGMSFVLECKVNDVPSILFRDNVLVNNYLVHNFLFQDQLLRKEKVSLV